MSQLLCQNAAAADCDAINLLQGGYAISQQHQNYQGLVRFSVSAAIVLVTVYVAFALSTGAYFNTRAEQLQQHSFSLYRELFPDDQRIISPRRQMQSHLDAQVTGAGDGRFIALLSHTAEQWPTGNQQPSLNQLSYEGAEQSLQLEVRANSINELEQLKQRLMADGVGVNGLRVELKSANEQADFVVGELTMGL